MPNGELMAVTNHATTSSLSSNLLELDSLLEELDTVELSDDGLRLSDIGLFVFLCLLLYRGEKYV